MNKSMLAIVGALLVMGLGVFGVAGWSWGHRTPNGTAPMSALTAQGQSYHNVGPISPGMMGGYGPMGSMMHGWGIGGMHRGMMGGWGYFGVPGGQSYTPTIPQQPAR